VTFERDYAVRFGEIDHAGVMYYPAILDRMHRAFEDFWPAVLGRSYADLLLRVKVGFPVVDLRVRFKRPFRFGETMRVHIDVLRVGAKSATFGYRLSDAAEPAISRADGEIVCAVVDMDSFAGCALPDELRSALLALVPEPPA
jgi:4-hydroxybenzoyl-CoA thioesterase